MLALNLALPRIMETLVDDSTRAKMIRVLIDIMAGDERLENRVKAIYLLGQIGFYLGATQEHEDLMKCVIHFNSPTVISIFDKNAFKYSGFSKIRKWYQEDRRAQNLALSCDWKIYSPKPFSN